ncbi:hypothetical protein CY0110_18157 [Crocosphaera chwakensis CCY0110]|uniref:Uncharacterized protein n=1 Tax=Crocosphaera chwakensis CCY0110 TaxID=391612 RepID=A3IIW3_9CHRO|nr:hypothetical protein CY0110_18157 [Crocosphaera chwakensis CCY0110]
MVSSNSSSGFSTRTLSNHPSP